MALLKYKGADGEWYNIIGGDDGGVLTINGKRGNVGLTLKDARIEISEKEPIDPNTQIWLAIDPVTNGTTIKYRNLEQDWQEVHSGLGRKSPQNGEIFNDISTNVATGANSHVEGIRNNCGGEFSHVEGNENTLTGSAAHAEGKNNKISANSAHIEGELNEIFSSADFSHAEGSHNQVKNTNAHSEGSQNQSLGANSHTEGNLTIGQGNNSHAEGYNNKAIGNASHAEGNSNSAEGNNSHVEGDNNKATGISSHAEGRGTVSAGTYSHAEGFHTISKSAGAHVEGSYNLPDEQNKYLHIVGNGKSEAERSNGYTLDWLGKGWLANDLLIGGKNADDPNAISIKQTALPPFTLDQEGAVLCIQNNALTWINLKDRSKEGV